MGSLGYIGLLVEVSVPAIIGIIFLIRVLIKKRKL